MATHITYCEDERMHTSQRDQHAPLYTLRNYFLDVRRNVALAGSNTLETYETDDALDDDVAHVSETDGDSEDDMLWDDEGGENGDDGDENEQNIHLIDF